MAVSLRIINVLFCLAVGVLALIWFVSTDQQRQEYLLWFGLAKPPLESEPVYPPVIDQTITNPLSQFTHGAVSHYQCAPTTRAVTDVETSKVYKWKDESGRVHFSDRAPQQASVKDLSQKYQNKAQYFRVKVDVSGSKVPAWTQDRLAGSTRQIFTILADQLNMTDLRQIDLNVKVFASRQAYQSYANQVAPSISKWSAGFYSSRINTAAVHHDGRDERTHQVARHESTHVIMSGLFGSMPIWFTEGMAEYFEHMKITGQAKIIEPDREQMALLQKLSLPHLQHWFDQAGNWYNPQNRNENYAIAWSVIHFLMQDNQRKQVLANYMKDLGKDLCREVSAAEFFAREYPGGLRRMTQDWQRWVSHGAASPHYF
ncbi:DUF4124 domain-containing protein [Parendozoicomonas sp. Alg238-R29]|uniref:DUF4124 domain-containing protein n=1 Tax=Parendozoicomonas sp. Alg238-R29 TaxID=2993446 RepID=UPI00248F40D1|nr:DUF4124 domain-containing protein [Parendozoicomonas sp. Alg238-R29]